MCSVENQIFLYMMVVEISESGNGSMTGQVRYSSFQVDRYYDELKQIAFEKDSQSIYVGVMLKKKKFYGGQVGIYTYNFQQDISTFNILHRFHKSKYTGNRLTTLVRRTSLFKATSKGFYAFVVGNMFGDPVERSFLMNIQQGPYSYEYQFTNVDLQFSADNIVDLDCTGDQKQAHGSCALVIQGQGIKMVEFDIQDQKVNITQYANYKSHQDFKCIYIQKSEKYFSCLSFSTTQLRYAILVYNSDWMLNPYLHGYLDSNVDQEISTQNFKFRIVETSFSQEQKFNSGLAEKTGSNIKGSVADYEQVLAFIKVQTNQQMFVYSVNELSVQLNQNLSDMSKSQLRSLLRMTLDINSGEFQMPLGQIFNDIKTGLGSAMIGLLVLACIVIMSLLICVIYKCSRKETEEEMQQIMQDLDASRKASEREIEQKRFWVENLSPEQINVIEGQKANDIEDELNSRLMNQSINTIDDFENGAVC